MSKNTIVVFTTRKFDEKENLFNSSECERIDLSNDSCLGAFHVKNQLEKEVNDFLIKKYQKFKSNKEKLGFLDKMRGQVKSEHHAKIDGMKDSITFNTSKKTSVSINDLVLFDRSQPNPFSFDEIIEGTNFNQKPPLLKLRKFIYKRDNLNIFGYRCLDLYNDIVDSQVDFISSLVKDIAAYLLKKACDNTGLLNGFFDSYHLVLVLHEEDISYPKGFNKRLSNKDMNKYLFNNNKDLSSFENEIETYVFQHTANIFVQCILSFDDSLNEGGLSEKFRNHTVDREAFGKQEMKVFTEKEYSGYIPEMKEILKKFTGNNKIY